MAFYPDVSSDHLIAFQEEIQDLQRQLLKIKLTCREQVMATFTGEQRDNFAFIVSDNPKLASLMPQVQALNHETYSEVARHQRVTMKTPSLFVFLLVIYAFTSAIHAGQSIGSEAQGAGTETECDYATATGTL